MAEELAYTTSKRKEKPVKFEIDGRPVEFKPPKRAGMVLPVFEADKEHMGVMAMKSQYDWLAKGLGEETAQWLEDRLKDDTDDFDTEDLDRIFDWVMKQVNGRPTG